MEPFIQAAAGINVEEIMAAIQKKIQDKKDAGLLKQSEIDEIVDMELQPLPDFLEIPHVYEPILYPGFAEKMTKTKPPAPRHPKPVRPRRPPRPVVAAPAAADEAVQETGLAKGILKKLRSVLFPMIRFMSRPLYSELKTGIMDNQKMSQELVSNQNGFSEALEDLRYDFQDSLADFLDFKSDILDLYMDMAPIVLQSREYVCLLHNALHNIIVEASKLKTEEEMLKTKIRILEDKIEFLENRQRALEKN
jgi:hypothetical protein